MKNTVAGTRACRLDTRVEAFRFASSVAVPSGFSTLSLSVGQGPKVQTSRCLTPLWRWLLDPSAEFPRTTDKKSGVNRYTNRENLV